MVRQRLMAASLFLGAITFTSACSAQQGNVGNGPSARQAAATSTGNNVTNEQLPISQRFRSLDEFLAYLEKTRAPVDGAWYKAVRPGIYELQTGNLRILGRDGEGAPKRIFTREELEKKFGFSR